MAAGTVVGDKTQMTAGGGQVLIDRRDIGHTKGKLVVNRETELLVERTGIPKSTILQLPIGEEFKLEIHMMQVGNIENLGLVMGITPRTQSATPVVVPFGGSPSASQARTFAVRNGSTTQFIKVAPNISSVTVKNDDETVTYVANTDYVITHAGAGLIMRIPGGDIAEGETVHLAYTTTPVSYEELLLGKLETLKEYQVEYLHISPVGGWLLHYCFWRCQVDGSIDLSLDTEAGSVMLANAKLTAIRDEENHPSSSTVGPTGFVRLVPANLVSAYLETIEIEG